MRTPSIFFGRLPDDKAGGAADPQSAGVGDVFLDRRNVTLIFKIGLSTNFLGLDQSWSQAEFHVFGLQKELAIVSEPFTARGRASRLPAQPRS
jgi:hypothetical protein